MGIFTVAASRGRPAVSLLHDTVPPAAGARRRRGDTAEGQAATGGCLRSRLPATLTADLAAAPASPPTPTLSPLPAPCHRRLPLSLRSLAASFWALGHMRYPLTQEQLDKIAGEWPPLPPAVAH